MRKARQSAFERLESYLVRLIQEKGDDLDQPNKRLYIRVSMQALELYGEELKKKT